MAEGQVLIKDLPEALSVSDSSFIPVDNGNLTQKITVENFNESSNQTAKGYAEQAAASATTAQEAIADVNNKVDLAQGFANSAAESSRNSQTYATNSQTYAGNSQGYANTAQGHATNAAASASSAAGASEAANEAATLAKSFCQGGTGARPDENINNAKYWASVAETAAQLHIDDHIDPDSTNPVQNKVIYKAFEDMQTGGSVITVTTNETTLRGKTATITNGTTTYTAVIDQTGKAVFEGVLLTGALTISASDGSRTATSSLTVPYFGIYSASLAFWSATIAVSTSTSEFDGLTVYAKKGGATLASGTFTSGSASLVVPEAGTYTIEVTLDWKTYTTTTSVSSQTTYNVTIDGFIATVDLSTPTSEFYGEDISVTLDGSPIDVELSFDSIGEASFTALQAGAYVFTVIYAGEPYTASVTVSDETTYTEEIKMWTATITVTGSSQLQLQPLAILRNGIQVGTSQFNASGTATVIVHEAGSYTFEADYDSYTYSSDAVSVVAETIYSTSITVFVATLSISTSSIELYGQTISIELDGDVVATTAFSSSGSASIRVHATGDYTCSCVYAGETYSDSVTVSSETTYPVQIDTIPEGSTVLPTDDIQTWLKCAGLDKAYTTLSEVLADHDTLYLLMGSDNAVDYLVRSTTWASGITADEYGMKYIGKWNYASDTLLDDSTWASAIGNSAYIESILNVSVPLMTGASAPSGTAFAKNSATNWEPYKAFNRTVGYQLEWQSASETTGTEHRSQYVGYQFPSAVVIKAVQITNRTGTQTSTYNPVEYSLEGSNSGQNTGYTTIADFNGNTTITRSGENDIVTVNMFDNDTAYSYYRITNLKMNGSIANADVPNVQFYGRQDVTEGIDVYGAASDTMTVTGNGITLTITTDSSGHYIVPKTSLPNGTYTFTSGVAKDPSNLSNDYSKSVTVTDGTSEIYFMPDGAYYWYGCFVESFSAYSIYTGAGTTAFKPTLTLNTHNFVISRSSSGSDTSMGGGAYFDNAIDFSNYTKLSVIWAYNIPSSTGTGNSVGAAIIDSLQQGYNTIKAITHSSSQSQSLTHSQYLEETDITGATTGYLGVRMRLNSSVTGSVTVTALWLE